MSPESQKNALDYAARLLAPRAMSEKTLREKLEKKEFAPEDIQYAVERLTEMGGLNDREFAQTVARYYRNKGFGRQKVAQELRRRGIGKELSDEVLEGFAPCSEKVVSYLEKVIQGNTHDKRVIRKAAAGLYRRGFSWEQIDAAIDVYCDDTWQEEEKTETEE